MKTTILRILFIILLIVMFFIIFGFSQQDGEESSNVSRKVTVEVTENVKKIQKLEKSKKEQYYKSRKSNIYCSRNIKYVINEYFEKKKRVGISVTIGLLYAIFDKIHQSFVSKRLTMITGEMIDTK